MSPPLSRNKAANEHLTPEVRGEIPLTGNNGEMVSIFSKNRRRPWGGSINAEGIRLRRVGIMLRHRELRCSLTASTIRWNSAARAREIQFSGKKSRNCRQAQNLNSQAAAQLVSVFYLSRIPVRLRIEERESAMILSSGIRCAKRVHQRRFKNRRITQL